ncbi:hypothetical protein ACIBCB_25025 [Streptomyces uncialis]|uniref:hypothetical protein n=1 Tax=Streptomyces uncialis TaxID=1048205 RepID=UPI00379D6AEB
MPEQETSSTVAQAADDGRRLVLRPLTLEIEGGTPTTWQLDDPQALAELKEKGFTLTEGSHYKLRYAFQVRHDIISGLTYVSATSRQRIKVDKEQALLGAFGPQAALHKYTVPRSGWSEAPSGPLLERSEAELRAWGRGSLGSLLYRRALGEAVATASAVRDGAPSTGPAPTYAQVQALVDGPGVTGR